MFSKPPASLRLTLRALARLIGYPDAELRAVLPQLALHMPPDKPRAGGLPILP